MRIIWIFLSLDFAVRQTKIHKRLSIYDFLKKLDWVPKVSQNLENTIVTESTLRPITHSSVVSLGRPLGSVVRPLLLQRTTVSRQEHSAGHLSTGEQLFSSLPEGRMGIRGERKGDKKWQKNADVAEPVKNVILLHLTIFTGKVLDSYILNGDLL